MTVICSNCCDGSRSAAPVRFLLDGTPIEISVCDPCRNAFEAQEWIEVVAT